MTGRTARLALCVLLAAGACGERDAPASPALTRVAFGSCAFQWDEQPIWRAVEGTEPDLFLDFLGEPDGSERRTRPGIHDAKVFGPPGRRVQVILLDTRTFKSPPRPAKRPPEAKGSLGKFAPNDDPDATLLGPAQWAWLEARLREPADVRLLVSSTQVVADEKGMDEWGGYPRERERLFDLVEETAATGVVVLSGNVHFAEVSLTDEGPYPILDFTSSGLTHVDETYPTAPNRHRVAGPFVDLNFGLVEVDWEAPGGPVIKLAAVGVDGRREFEHQVLLARLAPSSAKRRGGR